MHCRLEPSCGTFEATSGFTRWTALLACSLEVRSQSSLTGVVVVTFDPLKGDIPVPDVEGDKIRQTGSHLKPLFMTKQNAPIHSTWLSKSFSEIDIRARIQKKVSHRIYKIRAHSVRHLLKSTPNTYGCAPYAADRALGHAPRDTYEKQAVLYPEKLREEYAKASPHTDIFSKVKSMLNAAKDPESQDARIKELETQAAGTNTTNAKIALLESRRRESAQKMHSAIESLDAKIRPLQQQRGE